MDIWRVSKLGKKRKERLEYFPQIMNMKLGLLEKCKILNKIEFK